jgi:transposase
VVSSEIRVQTVNHLGIIAGLIDEIGVVEQIDQLLGRHPKEVVSAGQVVKAMILNGLGFVSAPLYLFERFFEGKATEHLIGPGVRPEHLNDDRLGRVLDQLYLAGLTRLFVSIALKAAAQFGVATNTLHLDSSSFHVHGEYEANATELSVVVGKVTGVEQESERESAPKPIHITHGYSRDKRADLKQFIIDLICSGDGDVPLYLRVAALAFVMGLCLLVYSLGQRALRSCLVQAGETLDNQLGQPTQRPTLRWVFQCFQDVHLLQVAGVKQIANLTPERVRILRFLGSTCGRYYLMS